jgi:2-polyprenyl-6-hydroxyphenyl methylase/3-demethylubiquinone-9 3-methyltransferase
VEPPPVSAAAPELEVVTHTYDDFHQQPDPPHQPLYLRTVLGYLRGDPQIVSVLDAGCGDGNFTASVGAAGYTTYGLDMSESGIEIASSRGVGSFARGSIYEDLAAAFPGMKNFDAIIAIEVIEHLYSPREFVRRAFEALRPGGVFIVTTPYWGYLKNIALALTGRMDGALTALWDGGHIKHWSRRTLTSLLTEQSFDVIGFAGAGHRPPYLWNGMVIACRKPSNLPSPALRSGPRSPGDYD